MDPTPNPTPAGCGGSKIHDSDGLTGIQIARLISKSSYEPTNLSSHPWNQASPIFTTSNNKYICHWHLDIAIPILYFHNYYLCLCTPTQKIKKNSYTKFPHLWFSRKKYQQASVSLGFFSTASGVEFDQIEKKIKKFKKIRDWDQNSFSLEMKFNVKQSITHCFIQKRIVNYIKIEIKILIAFEKWIEIKFVIEQMS